MSGGGAAASVAVVLALLVGCSNEDPPASLPSAAPTTTTEATPTTTTSAPTTPATSGAPTVPAAAQEQTPDGAAAFVRNWYGVLEYSESVMQSAPVRALDDGTCLSCNNLADTIDSVADDGNRLDGGEVTIASVQPNELLQDGSTTVNTLVSFAEQQIVSPGGAQEVLGPVEEDAQLLFELAWVGSEWLVDEIRILQ